MAAIHRDVHIHSTYSFDGKSPVRAYICLLYTSRCV